MRSQISEYVLKGIYLGLLVFVALEATSWILMIPVVFWTLGGLIVLVSVAAGLKFRKRHQAKGRIVPFLLFILLENPALVYTATILGMAFRAFSIRKADSENLLFMVLGGGAALGVVLWLIRLVHNRWTRL